jgi:hypothetical protein
MNGIAIRENAPEFLRLMLARSQIYQEARIFQVAQLVLTVGVPFLAGLLGAFFPNVRPVAGALSVGLTLFDVSVLDRQQRNKLKLAARISEQFDTGVLELPWNDFIAKRVEPEMIERASSAWPHGDAKLRDWYTPSVGKAPIALGRILCQRANLQYDCRLRTLYGNCLVALAVLTVAILVIIAVSKNLPFTDWVLTIVAPAAPIFVWAIRERFRQSDTGKTDDTIRAGVETLWARTSTGAITAEESFRQSRTLQDAIFAHRSSSPMTFPFIYNHMRNKLEREMHAGIDDLLRSIGIS